MLFLNCCCNLLKLFIVTHCESSNTLTSKVGNHLLLTWLINCAWTRLTRLSHYSGLFLPRYSLQKKKQAQFWVGLNRPGSSAILGGFEPTWMAANAKPCWLAAGRILRAWEVIFKCSSFVSILLLFKGTMLEANYIILLFYFYMSCKHPVSSKKRAECIPRALACNINNAPQSIEAHQNNYTLVKISQPSYRPVFRVPVHVFPLQVQRSASTVFDSLANILHQSVEFIR